MAKTKKMIREHLPLIDIVLELLDARIPFSSKNPDINGVIGHKNRIIILNKADLASKEANEAWLNFFNEAGHKAIPIDSREKAGFKKLVSIIQKMMEEKQNRGEMRGRKALTIRAMALGIPNVGKSTFINQLAGRAGTATGDRPGVTRGRQWIRVNDYFELLDTPGVLWPKFDDKMVGIKLAATGAISDNVVDIISLAEELLALLIDIAPGSFIERYKLSGKPQINKEGLTNIPLRHILESIGAARGFLLKGGKIDTERAALTLLDEFRGGKLGAISLESPHTIYEALLQN